MLSNVADSSRDLVSEDSRDQGAGEEERSHSDLARFARLDSLVCSIDAAHLHTRAHSANVEHYAVAISRRMGLHARRIARVRPAAYLHDIGKAMVPEDILSKAGPLTEAEVGHIRLHSAVGSTMLASAGLRPEVRFVRAHHERFDGGGYPDGLAGEEIPLEARIIFVADSFEAMTSDRPYRRGMSVEEALDELRRCSGTQFDPVVVDVLLGLIGDGGLVAQPVVDPPQPSPSRGAGILPPITV